jgi:DNA-binding response OmpR family regulator
MVMAKRTVLYVSEEGADGCVAQRLRQAGFEVFTTRPQSAVAILFVNRRLDAVVLEDRGNKESACALAALLRSIRAEVPIVLVSASSLDGLPSGVDACVNPENSLEMLAGILSDRYPPTPMKGKAEPAA